MECGGRRSSVRVCTNSLPTKNMSGMVARQKYRRIHLLSVFALHTAWGETEVSAVLLLPQVECLKINTISNSPTQKAVAVFKRPFILSSCATGGKHVSLQPSPDCKHICTATHRCNCDPCRSVLANFKPGYVGDGLTPTASPPPPAAEGHQPTTTGISAKDDKDRQKMSLLISC